DAGSGWLAARDPLGADGARSPSGRWPANGRGGPQPPLTIVPLEARQSTRPPDPSGGLALCPSTGTRCLCAPLLVGSTGPDPTRPPRHTSFDGYRSTRACPYTRILDRSLALRAGRSNHRFPGGWSGTYRRERYRRNYRAYPDGP